MDWGNDGLAELLELATTGDATTAVEWRDGGLTRAELRAAVDALADLLVELGAPRTTVLLFGPLCPAYVVGLLAALRCGAVPVPVDAGLDPDRYAWTEGVARPSVLVTSDVSTVAHFRGRTDAGEVLLDAATGRVALTTSPGAPTAWRYPTPDAGYLIPTSGSTGEAKAVVGSRSGLHAFLSWFVAEFGLHAGDTCAAVTRVNFDPSLRELLAVLVAGGRLRLPEVDAQLDPRAVAEHFAAGTSTVAFLVPSLARRVADALHARSATLPDLRLAFFAGEVLPTRVVERWARLAPGAEFVNLYGMTEGTLAQLYRRGVTPTTGGAAKVVPVGRPRPGVEVRVDQPGPDGHGEVLVTSAKPALGTLADGGGSAPGTFRIDPMPATLRTGDVGRRTDEGELVIVGRLGNTLKVAGKRVSFDRLVAAVEDLPGVDQCVVVDRQGPHVFVAAPDPGALRELVLDVVKRLELPRPVVHVRAELPLLRSGKVDRVALAASVEDTPVVDAAAGRGVEDALLDLLGLDAPESFVDVGLSSLDMMDFALEVNRRFGADLSVRDCFEHRDVASLARAIERSADRTAPTGEVLGGDPGPGPYPLSTRQHAYMAITMADGNANWCNLSREIPVDRALSTAEVGAAVAELVARHDVLRLALTPDWSRQVHVDTAGRGFAVTVHESSGDHDDHRDVVQRARVEAVAELVDPTLAPAIRVALVRGRETGSVILVAHHLFVDGLSLDLLAADFRALLRGERPDDVPRQGFRGYCVATRRSPEPPAADVEHWTAFLSGVRQVELPEAPGADAQDGMLVSRPFGVACSRAAHRVAEAVGVSVFAVVLAAFERAVAEEFGLGPLSVVVPVQVREGYRTSTAGMFMSQLVVRGTGSTSLRDNARELARQVEVGTAHSAWEFDQRVEALGLAGSAGFPLSTVLFNQHPKPRGLRVRDLGSRSPRELGRKLRYQLQGELQMSAGEIALTYYYRRGIAPDGTGVVDRVHARVLAAVSAAGRAGHAD
ncbi:AMP-binding protein [Saccharothrix luteola]|uniref:AMP-binding protein n=1 Tax=Saccharothrix luteola TaxID=2893018 RepID=UPI001E3C47F5|nr:AMP-binding protein [Saccharothrix luteola]MCC8247054.1 AMP-binding protein [Saccharothrix luteola]MCC8249905.1 AMP-binding protein [Saccharothrix luteola]